MKILQIERLSHRFSDGSLGLDGIDLEIEQGEFVVIAGMNGSGKTTLLRHINGLLLPGSGKVVVDGVSVASDPARARRTVGMVFQDADSQIVGETVYTDVAFGPENLKLKRKEIDLRVREALKATGLMGFEEKNPGFLSGGEKRRLAVAGVLAMRPRILLFDEPFSNLDYPGIRSVLEQILTLNQKGSTIILTTHDLEKVALHATRIVVLKNGSIVENGTPGEVLPEVENYGIRKPCSLRLGKPLESWLN